MRSFAGMLLIIFVVVLNVLLGIRGLSREGVDFFTMKPFNDPIVHCEIDIADGSKPITFPEHSYAYLPTASFTARVYLEVMPLYARGLAQSLYAEHPNAVVHIQCIPVHGTAGTIYSFSSE